MSDTLQWLVDNVGIELWEGHLHLTISRAIDDSLRAQGRESPLLAIAPTFFIESLSAHWNMACLGIAKVFDRRKDTVTLRRMVEQAKAQAGAFSKLTSEQARHSCAEWMKMVQHMESKCDHVQERRNEVIAHFRLTRDGKPSRARSEPIPYEDLEGLYSQAIGMTNKLAECYKGDKAMLISFHAADLCKAEFRRLRQVLLAQIGREIG